MDLGLAKSPGLGLFLGSQISHFLPSGTDRDLLPRERRGGGTSGPTRAGGPSIITKIW